MNHPFYIEVEIGTYCNRTCLWCPNAWDDRGKARKYMSNTTWVSIIQNLKENQYSGWFALHNYNEPLADPSIFEKLQYVRNELPMTKIAIYTNGDYLDVKKNDFLLKTSINEVRVTLYPLKKEYLDAPSEDKIIEFVNKLFPNKTVSIFTGKRGLETKFTVNKTQYHIISPLIKGYTDRAGDVRMEYLKLLERRVCPCYLPTHSAAIDYLGNLKLCCQIYDVSEEKHRDYNIGNVLDVPFFDLWFSPKMEIMRNNAAAGLFDTMTVCQGCSHAISSDQQQNLKLK